MKSDLNIQGIDGGRHAAIMPARLIAAGLLAIAWAGAAQALTWHVPDQQPTVAAGLTVAAAGDTVLVAGGVYVEHDLEMIEGVVLRGATGAADGVTIDAMDQGRVLNCNGLSAATAVEGLTLANGMAQAAGIVFCNHADVVFRDCAFVSGSSDFDGAGFYCNESAPVLERCVFSGNTSDAGYGGGFSSRLADPVLRSCVFMDNGTGGWGGGFFATGSDNAPLLDKCVFVGNRADLGGAVACRGTLARLVDCELIENAATGSGGGLYLDFGAFVTLTDVRFERNTADQGKAGLVEINCYAILECCVLDRTTLNGDGFIHYDDEGCDVGRACSSWGALKRMFR